MFNLVHIFTIIYVLDLIMLLIWKLPNYLTIQKNLIRLRPVWRREASERTRVDFSYSSSH
jgi:hypothetical protein